MIPDTVGPPLFPKYSPNYIHAIIYKIKLSIKDRPISKTILLQIHYNSPNASNRLTSRAVFI